MRWLLLVLLVSLGALLFAAAGVARHIRLHRGQRGDSRSGPSAAFEPAEEPDVEVKH